MARSQRSKSNIVTIRSVAERAGVSAMTVSNVVNSRGRVGEETAAAVRKAIEELGYTPNVAARNLASAAPTRVGLIYTNEQTPFLDSILVGVLKATTARGLQLIIRDSPSYAQADAENALRGLVYSGADALLLIPPYAEIVANTPRAVSGRLPAAAIATGRSMEGIFTVRIDNRRAIRDMVRLLVAKGHRRIGYIGGHAAHSDASERRVGFEEGLREAGISMAPELIFQGDFLYPSGEAAGSALLGLADRPTAIISANDDMAAGLIAQAHRMGLRLPDDLAVTGFDDTAPARRLWPPLTTIRQPVGEMAFRAAEMLIEALQSPRGEIVCRDVVIEHELIERESTSRPPAR
ncbi:LacI family DNA-binding transcriptional regulator [Sandaracinobacteroides hominis]|uniref:LacI family DNA-binding transcriptional regulator n=1 Tax=Sandaracinobacteroides hominis TaxID=2780086 RepID=UPI0018F2D8DB|nr:LacI family DNA-binding transcriptional regulator [Sandaracinobacteroides hominis]